MPNFLLTVVSAARLLIILMTLFTLGAEEVAWSVEAHRAPEDQKHSVPESRADEEVSAVCVGGGDVEGEEPHLDPAGLPGRGFHRGSLVSVGSRAAVPPLRRMTAGGGVLFRLYCADLN